MRCRAFGEGLIRPHESMPNVLAATLRHVFGASSGSNLAGKINAYVASFLQLRFVLGGQKLDAQVLATASRLRRTTPARTAARSAWQTTQR
jgi:hypothetical protein